MKRHIRVLYTCDLLLWARFTLHSTSHEKGFTHFRGAPPSWAVFN